MCVHITPQNSCWDSTGHEAPWSIPLPWTQPHSCATRRLHPMLEAPCGCSGSRAVLSGFIVSLNCPFLALAPLSTLKGREQLGGTPSAMPQSRGSRSLTPDHAGCSLISRVNKPDTVIYWVCFSLHLWNRKKSRSYRSWKTFPLSRKTFLSSVNKHPHLHVHGAVELGASLIQ